MSYNKLIVSALCMCFLLCACVFRINQARVYLQAYRVGYKILCPDKKGR